MNLLAAPRRPAVYAPSRAVLMPYIRQSRTFDQLACCSVQGTRRFRDAKAESTISEIRPPLLRPKLLARD
jgi:hypothetical protein